MASGNNGPATVSAAELKHAEAGAEKDAAPGNVSETCATCIAEDCKKKIEQIEKETKQITDIKDPIERNKAITAAYGKLAAQDPSNRWIKLASVVSAQGGCAMKLTRSLDPDVITGIDPKYDFMNPTGLDPWYNMYQALGDANKAIFGDIYPMAAYRARHGYEDMKKCYAATGKVIPPKIKSAFDELEKGNLKSASDWIADFEQRDVVQPVYENYSGTFSMMEGASAVLKPVLKKNLYDIPVSTTCGDPNVVPFVGSISNPNHRVNYYNSLMNRLSSQQDWKW